MTINIQKENDQVLLTVAGRLDTVTAPQLEQAFAEQVLPTDRVVLDLGEVAYISSAGLRVLLGAQKCLQTQGSLTLKNVCEPVMEVFEMTGFAEILTIE